MTTSSYGAGSQPAGSSAAGYGTPALGHEPFGDLLQIAETGAMSSARLIDQTTRDYVLDADSGRLRGMNAVHQIVQMSVQTNKASSAVREMGNELHKVDRITDNFQLHCLTILTDALQSPISRGLVEILDFSVFKAARGSGLREGQTYGRLRWRDLTTGKDHKEII